MKYPVKITLSSFGVCVPLAAMRLKRAIRHPFMKEMTCLVIPYAGFDAKKTFERERQGLIKFGFSPKRIKCLKKKRDLMKRPPDYIYVPGGDPFKLLKTLKKMGVMEPLAECIQRGSHYIGVSAGASLLCQSIEYVMQLEDNNEIEDGDFEGLNIIKECVLCHYDHYSLATLKACREVSGKEMLTLKDDQVLRYKFGLWRYEL